jgi:hypothetical protein
MSGRFKKKKGNSKQAWLDWLADEGPSTDAKAELRERFKQQANSYQPRRPQPVAPAAPQTTVVAPGHAPQAQPVSNTTPAPNHASTASNAPAPATVSIQIHIPVVHTERFRRAAAKVKGWIPQLKTWIFQGWEWLRGQYQYERKRTVGIGVGVVVVIALLFLPPLFNFGYGKDKTAKGGSGGTNAGATTKIKKPTYEVVRPSSKPQLAEPDGVHAAYDSKRQSYSFRDYMGDNGFTVSQQPVPPQFKDGATAVETLAPTLVKGVKPTALKTLFGTAYVATNPKYSSQALVLTVRDLLIFIQSGHAYTNDEWVNYINALQ